MYPVGLANTRISSGYAQKSPRSLNDSNLDINLDLYDLLN